MEDKKILFTGMKARQSQIRYVKSEIEGWICREQSALMPGNTEYFACIDYEEESSYYNCFVEVEFGPHKLTAFEGGETLSAALSNALRRMRVSARQKPRQKYMETAPFVQSVA